MAQLRERRDYRRAAGRRLHRDRDHVVDQQCHRRDLCHPRTEVFPGHYVGSARPGVDGHHLAVGQHHQHDPSQHHQGHRQDQCERRQPHDRQHLDEDLLGTVCGRGDAVAGKHTQRERPGQPLVLELLIDHRGAEEAPFHGIPEALRKITSGRPVKETSRLAQSQRLFPSILWPGPGPDQCRACPPGQGTRLLAIIGFRRVRGKAMTGRFDHCLDAMRGRPGAVLRPRQEC